MKLTAVSQIKNTALYEAAKTLGSQHALAELLEVSDMEVGRWIRLLSIPDLKRVRKLHPERWKRIEEKLIHLTGQFLEDIFPQELLGSDFLDQPKIREVVIDVPVMSLLDAPKEFLQLPPVQEEAVILDDQRRVISEVLGSLTPREEKVLRARFGLDDGHEKTLEEVGRDYLGVSRTRTAQIEGRALRKLRHPSRLRKLMHNQGYIFVGPCTCTHSLSQHGNKNCSDGCHCQARWEKQNYDDISSPLPKLVKHQGDSRLNPSYGSGTGGRVGPSGLLTNTKCRSRPIFGEHCWHPITRQHMDRCCYCNRPRGRYSSIRIEQAIDFRHRFSGSSVTGDRKDFLKKKPKRANHRNFNASYRWKYKNLAEREESRRRRVENLIKGAT